MEPERFNQYMLIFNEIAQEAQAILTKYSTLREEILKEKVEGFDYLKFNRVEDNCLIYEGDEYWAFQGYQHHYLEIPAKMLYDPDWEEVKDGFMKIRLKKEDKENQEKAHQQELKRKQYEALRTEFGG